MGAHGKFQRVIRGNVLSMVLADTLSFGHAHCTVVAITKKQLQHLNLAGAELAVDLVEFRHHFEIKCFNPGKVSTTRFLETKNGWSGGHGGCLQ